MMQNDDQPFYTQPQYDDPLPPPPIDNQSDLENFYSEDLSTKVPESISASQEQQQQQSGTGRGEAMKTILNRFAFAEDNVVTSSRAFMDHSHPKLFVRVSILLVLLMLSSVLLWVFTTPRGYPWFIHVFWLALISIGLLFILGSPKPLLGNKPFSIHLLISTLTSFMFILMNEHLGSFPWVIYILGAAFVALSIHAAFTMFPKYSSHFHIHVLIWFVGNLLIFLTWCYTRKGGKIFTFPWFIFPLMGWTGLLALHLAIWIVIKRKRANNVQQGLQDIQPATFQPTYDDPNYNNQQPPPYMNQFAQPDAVRSNEYNNI